MLEIKNTKKIYQISVDGVVHDIPVRNFNAEIGLTLAALEESINKIAKEGNSKTLYKQIELLFEMIGVCLENKEHWVPWLKRNLPMNEDIIHQFFEGVTVAMISNEGIVEKKNGARKRSKPTEKIG